MLRQLDLKANDVFVDVGRAKAGWCSRLSASIRKVVAIG
jgi:hypothetical protein